MGDARGATVVVPDPSLFGRLKRTARVTVMPDDEELAS